MATSLRQRLSHLESYRGARRSVKEMTDAELEALLAPEFGGRVPTDEELERFLGMIPGSREISQ